MAREYTTKEMKKLKENPYTFKVTKGQLQFTAEFKQVFWRGYQAGVGPRKLLCDLGYDVSIFGQKQIDSIVQRIKKQSQSGSFSQGEHRGRSLTCLSDPTAAMPESLERICNEVKYLRQEVEFLKKITKQDNSRKGNGS